MYEDVERFLQRLTKYQCIQICEFLSGDKVYEDVERLLQRSSTHRGRPDAFERNVPARRSVIMDVFGKSGSLHRALWCEMPEVRELPVRPLLLRMMV